MSQLQVFKGNAAKIAYDMAATTNKFLPAFPMSELDPKIAADLEAEGLGMEKIDLHMLLVGAMELRSNGEAVMIDEMDGENHMFNTPEALKMYFESEKLKPAYDYLVQ